MLQRLTSKRWGYGSNDTLESVALDRNGVRHAHYCTLCQIATIVLCGIPSPQYSFGNNDDAAHALCSVPCVHISDSVTDSRLVSTVPAAGRPYCQLLSARQQQAVDSCMRYHRSFHEAFKGKASTDACCGAFPSCLMCVLPHASNARVPPHLYTLACTHHLWRALESRERRFLFCGRSPSPTLLDWLLKVRQC